ncbi:hypothetical protein ES703_58305 [subsurface metagenome]
MNVWAIVVFVITVVIIGAIEVWFRLKRRGSGTRPKKGVNLVVAKAFVLIETAVGRNTEVIATLRQIEEVKSADTVTGPYDVIATIEGGTFNHIGDLLTAKIHPIAGISSTVTCLVMQEDRK